MDALNGYLMKTAHKVACDSDMPWDSLTDATIMITGATGLIGSQFVRVMLERNDVFDEQIQLVLPVRNIERAKSLFGIRPEIDYQCWELGQPLSTSVTCDYLIHGACGTSSASFAQQPATTITTIVSGGIETLRAAKTMRVKKYAFLSSMEVYGQVNGIADEKNIGVTDPMLARSSYPEAKRLVECLCKAYSVEHSLPTVVLRLAQTFGQGVSKQDRRVFAEFARSAREGKNIILFTDGSKRNAFLSVDDAVRAIVFTLVYGEPGEAYNAANESTYCSVKEMAEMVLREFGVDGSEVRREFDGGREAAFPKPTDLRLSVKKLMSLGWQPKDDMYEMYRRLLASMDLQDSL